MNTNVTSTVEDPALVEKRRRQIVAAATKLFSDQGFYKTTIKDIAKEAGISSGLVYLYVREKEDVLLLVLLQVVNSYAQEIPKAMESSTDPLERLLLAVEAYCAVVDRHRAATVLAYRSTKSLSPDRRLLIQQRETETNDIIAAAKLVIDAYAEAQVDLVLLGYSRFVSTLNQQPTLEQLLPVMPPEANAAPIRYIYEPDEDVVLDELLPRYVETRLFQALLETKASEFSAKMVAMRNATDNANNLTKDLTLVLNKARQAGITSEIAEIAAGMSALG